MIVIKNQQANCQIPKLTIKQ